MKTRIYRTALKWCVVVLVAGLASAWTDSRLSERFVQTALMIGCFATVHVFALVILADFTDEKQIPEVGSPITGPGVVVLTINGKRFVIGPPVPICAGDIVSVCVEVER